MYQWTIWANGMITISGDFYEFMQSIGDFNVLHCCAYFLGMNCLTLRQNRRLFANDLKTLSFTPQ
jgi:hypothetical protein